ncbi:type Z 30S ribosomal protein S14 [Candidatus Dojkabacteria bacterium]|uniref:Small ribosomal subunit protein uS14 n=1 Tax=Candidatus Dojkabacteria bacterium TaxID=2099670 RepID=A0A955I510_9BACT|nr:type Z 30S ribosomal protein S14 [Candidatus Dojkabacteria bacterium]
MAGAAQKAAAKRKNAKKERGSLKHSTKAYNRCELCGRSHGYIRKFKVCRICFRKLAMNGELPGVRKATW